MVLIVELSHIPSVNSATQYAAPGDRFEARITWLGDETRPPHASVKALHPENDPWDGPWRLGVGDEYEAEVMRAVAESVRCGGGPGYLVALRPGASAILCGPVGLVEPGERRRVRVTEVDARSRGVRLERASRCTSRSVPLQVRPAAPFTLRTAPR